jgi:hypothetical protein
MALLLNALSANLARHPMCDGQRFGVQKMNDGIYSRSQA